MIAHRSPHEFLETGLRMCPAKKSGDSGPVLSWAVRSLPSGLSRKNREIRAYFAYFGVKRA